MAIARTMMVAAALVAGATLGATPAAARTWYWCSGVASGEGTTKWMYTYAMSEPPNYSLTTLAQQFSAYTSSFGWTVAAPVCQRFGNDDEDFYANQAADREAQEQSQARGVGSSKVSMPSP